MAKNSNKCKLSNLSNKLTEYAVKGVKEEDEELFINRLFVLFGSNSKELDLLVNGIPVAAEVIDKESLKKELDNCVEVLDAKINDDFDIIIKYTKKITRYFETDEDANKANSRWDGSNEKNNKYTIEKEIVYDTCILITEQDKLAKYLDIKYL